MAELVVIGYSSEAEADEVVAVLRGLERDLVIQTAGSAVVVRDGDGELRVATHTHATGGGAASCSLWGVIIGLLFFTPVGDRAASGPMGALFGKMADVGVADDFREHVANLLKPGAAAVAILFHGATPERTIDALAPYGGVVLRTPLSVAVDQHLQEALDAARRSAVAPA